MCCLEHCHVLFCINVAISLLELLLNDTFPNNTRRLYVCSDALISEVIHCVLRLLWPNVQDWLIRYRVKVRKYSGRAARILKYRQLHLKHFYEFHENMIYSRSLKQNGSEISPTRCNSCVFILRSGFTLHVSGDNLTHHQDFLVFLYW